MRVLITGGAGQIGTNLGLGLMQRGDEVVGIDKRANTWTDKLTLVNADLCACPGGDLPVKGKFDAVVHLAA